MSAKRYTFDCESPGEYECCYKEKPDGEVVMFEDHEKDIAALETKNDDANVTITQLRFALDIANNSIAANAKAYDALENKLSAISAAINDSHATPAGMILEGDRLNRAIMREIIAILEEKP